MCVCVYGVCMMYYVWCIWCVYRGIHDVYVCMYIHECMMSCVGSVHTMVHMWKLVVNLQKSILSSYLYLGSRMELRSPHLHIKYLCLLIHGHHLTCVLTAFSTFYCVIICSSAGMFVCRTSPDTTNTQKIWLSSVNLTTNAKASPNDSS